MESNKDQQTNEELNKKEDELEELNKLAEILKLKKKGEDIKDHYKFWDTQPVPNFKDDYKDMKIGPIEENNKVEEVKKEPYSLPKNFYWKDVDIKNSNDLQNLYEFLRDNYVEDDEGMFRFDYSKEFLKWHLTSPHYLKEWHISVIVKQDEKEKMVGFISGIPIHIYVHGNRLDLVEINFLCVNSLYRSKRIAPVLIKEVTRRVNLTNCWQAVYTSGTLIPKPICMTNYYHRNINLQKLLDVKFTYLRPQLNLARAKKLFNLPNEVQVQGLRQMEKKDVDTVYELLEAYLSKFKIRAHYTKEEVEHWFVPRKDIVYSYVIETEGKVTDFFSFYLLPSSILKHDTHKKLFAAYSFFNVANSISLKDLLKTALILAKKEGFDVFNALDIMDNESVFSNLLFSKGDGSLKYYLFNYLSPEVKPNELGIVLM